MTREVLWNFGALAVLAATGLALNILVGTQWSPAALGVLNQGLAAYVVASMLASVGINHSLLRALGSHASDVQQAAHRDRSATIIWAALVPTAVLALGVCAIYWFARHSIAAWLDSPGVATAMAASTPGLFCFALNKQLLAAVNGWRRMRTFALLTAARYLLLLVALWMAARQQWDADALLGIFSVSEALLLVVAGAEVARHCGRPQWNEVRTWMRTHLYFGLQSGAAAVLLELNAKIDIWMLGLWLTDTKVGFYTWAAMFAEGFWQVLVVLQNQVNPVMAQHLAAGNTAAVEALARSMRWKSVALVAGLGLLSLPAYSYIVEELGGTLGFSESVQSYRILVVGVVCAAAWQPMAQILLMANQPARHSVLMLCTVAVNIAANALLIPSYGLEGAALGTAISVAAGAGFLRYAARRYAGVRL